MEARFRQVLFTVTTPILSEMHGLPGVVGARLPGDGGLDGGATPKTSAEAAKVSLNARRGLQTL